LSELNNENELEEFKKNLRDRFGEIPFQTIDLLRTVELKWFASKIGFEKIILKNNKMICQFISDKENSYYSSGDFQRTLTSIHHNKSVCEIKEKKNNNGDVLLVIFKNIHSINEAFEKLQIF
jgi:transcription-repair coupling factor (superfamily II helicase)